MSRQLAELELVMRSLIDEHVKLLGQLEAQQSCMRTFRADELEKLTQRQESTRLRIMTLDTKRKSLAIQIGTLVRLQGEPTLSRLAETFPPRATMLLKLRDELRAVVARIQQRVAVAGKLAGSMLGHLNTAVRILAGAVEQAGVYTKQGTPRIAPRIGAMEAVG